jgi:hypothetical protein
MQRSRRLRLQAAPENSLAQIYEPFDGMCSIYWLQKAQTRALKVSKKQQNDLLS